MLPQYAMDWGHRDFTFGSLHGMVSGDKQYRTLPKYLSYMQTSRATVNRRDQFLLQLHDVEDRRVCRYYYCENVKCSSFEWKIRQCRLDPFRLNSRSWVTLVNVSRPRHRINPRPIKLSAVKQIDTLPKVPVCPPQMWEMRWADKCKWRLTMHYPRSWEESVVQELEANWIRSTVNFYCITSPRRDAMVMSVKLQLHVHPSLPSYRACRPSRTCGVVVDPKLIVQNHQLFSLRTTSTLTLSLIA